MHWKSLGWHTRVKKEMMQHCLRCNLTLINFFSSHLVRYVLLWLCKPAIIINPTNLLNFLLVVNVQQCSTSYVGLLFRVHQPTTRRLNASEHCSATEQNFYQCFQVFRIIAKATMQSIMEVNHFIWIINAPLPLLVCLIHLYICHFTVIY